MNNIYTILSLLSLSGISLFGLYHLVRAEQQAVKVPVKSRRDQ